MTGAERIAAERLRQVEALGFDRAHDMAHGEEELARAAACYVTSAIHTCDREWPWHRRWDKRPGLGATLQERVRALEKAGALCAAEIDRLLVKIEKGEA